MRLHCQEHGYMDEKTGTMAECPYCRIDELQAKLSRYEGAVEVDGMIGRDLFTTEKFVQAFVPEDKFIYRERVKLLVIKEASNGDTGS